MKLDIDLKLISKIIAVINVILMIIAIYYSITLEKRKKNYIRKLEKELKDTPDAILTDEEFNEMNEKYNKEFSAIYIKPNNIIIGFIIIISIFAAISVYLNY